MLTPAMTPSDKAFAIIKKWEKFKPTAYKPTRRDRWTIGWGHTKDVQEGDTATTLQGEAWLREDVQAAVDAINQGCTRRPTQNQFDALTSFVFNVGVDNFLSSHLLAHFNAGDIKAASDAFMKWDFQDGIELDGLENRRADEQDLFDLDG